MWQGHKDLKGLWFSALIISNFINVKDQRCAWNAGHSFLQCKKKNKEKKTYQGHTRCWGDRVGIHFYHIGYSTQRTLNTCFAKEYLKFNYCKYNILILILK